eukprot:15365077-Ditylum_brightwellii.AAC.1
MLMLSHWTSWTIHAIVTGHIVSMELMPTRARMMQHFADVPRLTSSKKPALAKNGKRCSSTFAILFAKHFPHDATAQ